MTTLGSMLGGLAVPLLPPATASDSSRDLALEVLAGYVSAVLNTYAADAWRAVAAGEPVVRRVFTHDPQDYEFSEGDLPALYLFRTGSTKPIEDMAEDYRVHYDNLRLFWVMPGTGQAQQRKRVPIISALGKLIDVAIDRGRDPVYVRSDDTDPTAARQGTVLFRAAGAMYIRVVQWTKTNLAIQMSPGQGEHRVYQALDLKIELQEDIVQGFDDLSSVPSLDLTVLLNDEVNPRLPFSEVIAIGSFSSDFSSAFS